MSTGAAGDGFLRGGCLSGADMGIQRRPYHKNCRCALHQSGGHCPHRSRHNNVAYPIRRSWSEGSLVLLGQSSPSPSSSPAAEIPRTNSQSVMCKEEEEEEDSPKI